MSPIEPELLSRRERELLDIVYVRGKATAACSAPPSARALAALEAAKQQGRRHAHESESASTPSGWAHPCAPATLSPMKWSILALLALGSLLPVGDAVLPAPLLAELKKQWPANRTVNLVFHGHSVPAGYHETPEVKPFESYPLLALARIKELKPHAVMNAIVTAIGGENCVQGAARFERDVLSMRPDVVFIDYALNDRGLPEAKVEEAWRAMARAARAQGVSVVFLTPTGAVDVRMDAPDEPLERCAALIRRVGAEEGVLVANVWAAWKRALGEGTEQSSLLSQSNHPNRAGHEVAAREIARMFATE